MPKPSVAGRFSAIPGTDVIRMIAAPRPTSAPAWLLAAAMQRTVFYQTVRPPLTLIEAWALLFEAQMPWGRCLGTGLFPTTPADSGNLTIQLVY